MNKKIAIALSQFNSEISARLKQGVKSELEKQGIKNFKIIEVPGVMEIPLTAQIFFQEGFDAVIALGSVIRGETDHYLACCRMVEQGCMQVQLKTNQPLIFGILMTDNKKQALERSGGKKGHIARTSVQAACKMLDNLETLRKR